MERGSHGRTDRTRGVDLSEPRQLVFTSVACGEIHAVPTDKVGGRSGVLFVGMLGLVGVGVLGVVLAVLMVRVPFLRVPNWPNAGVSLFLMGSASLLGSLSHVLLGLRGLPQLAGPLIGLAAALAFLAGMVAIFWVPRRLRNRFGAWDPVVAHPWLRRSEHRRSSRNATRRRQP